MNAAPSEPGGGGAFGTGTVGERGRLGGGRRGRRRGRGLLRLGRRGGRGGGGLLEESVDLEESGPGLDGPVGLDVVLAEVHRLQERRLVGGSGGDGLLHLRQQ